MTVGQHISTLRLLIRKFEDDSYLTDEQLYSLLVQANNIINKRRFDRNDIINDYELNYFTLEIDWVELDNCIDNCKIRRSIHKLPEPYSSDTNLYIKVETIKGETIANRKYNSLDCHPMFQGLSYRIRNQYVEILNDNKLKYIRIGGIWNDISEWTGIEACTTTDDNNVTCFDKNTATFQIESGYEFMAYSEILKLLNYYLSTEQIQDTLNNGD